MKRIIGITMLLLSILSCEKISPLKHVEDVCTEMNDLEFMKYCYENFDVNKDGKVSTQEASLVKEMNLTGLQIESIEGIKYFTGLQKLNCYNNKIEDADFCHNQELIYLQIKNNPTRNIDVSKCDKLATLLCDHGVIYVNSSQDISGWTFAGRIVDKKTGKSPKAEIRITLNGYTLDKTDDLQILIFEGDRLDAYSTHTKFDCTIGIRSIYVAVNYGTSLKNIKTKKQLRETKAKLGEKDTYVALLDCRIDNDCQKNLNLINAVTTVVVKGLSHKQYSYGGITVNRICVINTMVEGNLFGNCTDMSYLNKDTYKEEFPELTSMEINKYISGQSTNSITSVPQKTFRSFSLNALDPSIPTTTRNNTMFVIYGISRDEWGRTYNTTYNKSFWTNNGILDVY